MKLDTRRRQRPISYARSGETRQPIGGNVAYASAQSDPEAVGTLGTAGDLCMLECIEYEHRAMSLSKNTDTEGTGNASLNCGENRR